MKHTVHQYLSGRIHISWLVAWLSFGVLLGIAMALQTGELFLGSQWFIISAALGLVAIIKRTVGMVLIALIAGMTVGLWRGSTEQVALTEYAPYIGRSIQLQGLAGEDASIGKRGDQRMRLKNILIDGRQRTGTVWVSTAKQHDVKRGDTIVVKGLLTEGFGTIPAAMFRAEVVKVVRPVPGDIGRQVRDWFSGGVLKSLPAEQAGLALGYLVGQKQTLSEELNEQFRTVGLVHAVVASGFHLTVLVVLVRRLFSGISKYLSALAASGMIIGFIAITGLSPSMSRAGLISGLSLMAWYYGRVIHPLVLLPFAAAVTSLFNPSYIWGDIGWYLSFAAFAGVIILAPLLHDYFWGLQKRPGFLRTLLITTLAAQIATLPLVMYVFGYYSIYALPANLLVVPLVSLTMLLTFVAGIIGLALPAIAGVLATPLRLVLDYMMWVVDWMAGAPNAKTEITISMTTLVLSYLCIVITMWFFWYKTKHTFKSEHDII